MEEEKLIEAKGLGIFDYTIVAFVCNFYTATFTISRDKKSTNVCQLKGHQNLSRKGWYCNRPFTFFECSKYPLQSGKKVKLKVRIKDNKNPIFNR